MRQTHAVHPHSKTQGFTLVELIIVVVLLGIVSIGTFAYLGFGAQIFSDVVGREQLSAQSRFAIERLNRELRNALPLSPRVHNSGSCIEFFPIHASSAYLQIPSPGNLNEDTIVIAPADTSPDDVIGSYFFTGAHDQNRIHSSATNQRRIIDSIHVDDQQWTLEFTENANFVRQSRARRYFISTGPITWCIENGSLVRYQDYPLNSFNEGTRVLMGHGIVNPDEQPPFDVVPPTLQRNNLVLIDLHFSRREGLEPLILSHEVHLPNVP